MLGFILLLVWSLILVAALAYVAAWGLVIGWVIARLGVKFGLARGRRVG